MKKIIAMFLLTMMMFSAVGCSNTAQVSDHPWLDDLNYLCETLEKKHKNLYANISEEEFLAARDEIAANLDSMDVAEFYYALKSLVAKIGDAHTDLNFTESQYEYLQALGFAVMLFDDGWRLMMLEKEHEQYLGDQLVGINNVKIDEIFINSQSIMSMENKMWAQNLFSNTINFYEALQHLGVVQGDGPVILTIQDELGDIHEVEIQPMDATEIMNAEIVSMQPIARAATAPQGIYRAMELEQKQFFIQYNSCQEDPELPMKDFVAQVEDQLNNNRYQEVIIDLRYNTGGNSAVLEPMIEMLKELQEEQQFTVYTLIGANTFSSGIINAVQLQAELESTLVGTATGGNVNGYGELQFFSLKHIPLEVNYSTKYFELIEGYEGDSLYPDVEVKQTFNHYINGIDGEIEAIKQSNE